MLWISLAVTACFIGLISAQGEGTWDYSSKRGDMDPQHWYLTYEQCQGTRQSPIAIDCAHLRQDRTLAPLEFINYNKVLSGLNFHNDGHTVKLDIPASAKLQLKSRSLPAAYLLQQLHFHWGTSTQGGSEHRIIGKRWPLEMHLVHVNENIPANQTQIDKNGMIVVSVLFDYKRVHDEKDHLLAAFDFLTSVIPQVKFEAQNTSVNNFAVGSLLPKSASTDYLRYSGSLTTPPCAEVVEWHILTNTGVVTPQILGRFRSTRQRIHDIQGVDDTTEVQIQENDRPLQPEDDRPIRLHGYLGELPTCETSERK